MSYDHLSSSFFLLFLCNQHIFLKRLKQFVGRKKTLFILSFKVRKMRKSYANSLYQKGFFKQLSDSKRNKIFTAFKSKLKLLFSETGIYYNIVWKIKMKEIYKIKRSPKKTWILFPWVAPVLFPPRGYEASSCCRPSSFVSCFSSSSSSSSSGCSHDCSTICMIFLLYSLLLSVYRIAAQLLAGEFGFGSSNSDCERLKNFWRVKMCGCVLKLITLKKNSKKNSVNSKLQKSFF